MEDSDLLGGSVLGGDMLLAPLQPFSTEGRGGVGLWGACYRNEIYHMN